MFIDPKYTEWVSLENFGYPGVEIEVGRIPRGKFSDIQAEFRKVRHFSEKAVMELGIMKTERRPPEDADGYPDTEVPIEEWEEVEVPDLSMDQQYRAAEREWRRELIRWGVRGHTGIAVFDSPVGCAVSSEMFEGRDYPVVDKDTLDFYETNDLFIAIAASVIGVQVPDILKKKSLLSQQPTTESDGIAKVVQES